MTTTKLDWKEACKIAAAVIFPHYFGYLNIKIRFKMIKRRFSNLNYPDYTPPSWIFPPVWIALYTGMGFASYLVGRDAGGPSGDSTFPLLLYAAQNICHWGPYPLFYNKENIRLSIRYYLTVTGCATFCTFQFFKINRTAGKLMVPYLAWHGYIGWLNYSIYKLNTKPGKSQANTGTLVNAPKDRGNAPNVPENAPTNRDNPEAYPHNPHDEPIAPIVSHSKIISDV